MFVCFPRQLFATHPFFCGLDPHSIEPRLLLDNTVLTPQSPTLTTANTLTRLRMGKRKKKEQSGSVEDVLHISGEEKFFFFIQAQKFATSVLIVVSDFMDLRKVFHQCFAICCHTLSYISANCKRIMSQTFLKGFVLFLIADITTDVTLPLVFAGPVDLT